MNFLKIIAIQIIKFYRNFISPMKKPCCIFIPTCSEYALVAFEKHGFTKGVLLTLKRILKCHPFNPGGYDPI